MSLAIPGRAARIAETLQRQHRNGDGPMRRSSVDERSSASTGSNNGTSGASGAASKEATPVKQRQLSARASLDTGPVRIVGC